LFTPQTSGAVQLAAVAAIARGGDPVTPDVLLSDWKAHGPAVRTAVLDALLARTNWTETLLTRIEQGQISAADVDAAHRQRLLTIGSPDRRARAEKLFLQAGGGDRAKVVAAHQSVVDSPADAEAGAAVFAKRCGVCHQLRGAGHAVGPDLAALTDNSPLFLLTAILDPNRAVETKFVDYVAVTTSGLSYTGMLANETGNSITLLGQEGKQQTLLRSELEQLQSTGKSLMPEGIERDLSAADLANVIAYIRTAGPPRKKFPANQPQVITADTDATLQLLATRAEIYGQTLVLENNYKNLGYWQSENDRAVWQVNVPAAGKYTVRLQYACDDSAAGNQLVLEAGSRALQWKVPGTGGWDNYLPQEIGVIDLPAGKQQVVLHALGSINGSLLDLERVVLEPAK
jgi:putative heme-binding domain-containing protein